MNNINTNSIQGIMKLDPQNATIIGCGSIGSKIAIELARLGINELELWDDDTVEPHNLCNQVFTEDQIEQPKVIALKEKLTEICSVKVVCNTKRFKKEDTPEHNIVFLCVDSMTQRKLLMKELLCCSNIEWVIETRMGKDAMAVYAVNAPRQEKWKESSQYDDSVAEVSPCGLSISVGAISTIVAGLATWQYMVIHREEIPKFEILVDLYPHMGMIVT